LKIDQVEVHLLKIVPVEVVHLLKIDHPVGGR